MQHWNKCRKTKVIQIMPIHPYSRKIVAKDIHEIKRKTDPPAPDPTPIDPIDLSIVPTIHRYFYVPTANIDLTSGVMLSATLFYTDDGINVDKFTIASPNGYVNLYINAVMQEGGFYTVDAHSLVLIPTEGRILAATPIIIESLLFKAAPVQ